MDELTKIEIDAFALSNFIMTNAQEIRNKIYPKQFSSSYGYIISYLCHNPENEIYQRDIEREFALGRSTVSNILKELEKQGLVERSIVNGDARLKRVVATQGARLINSACNKEIDAFLKELCEGVTAQDMDSLSRVLATLRTNAGNMK